MRKLMAAVMVVSGLGLVTGCERKSDIQQQRENVAEAQREVIEKQTEANQELAETYKDAREDVTEAREDLAEAQGKLAEKQYEQLSDGQAVGGSGVVGTKADMEEVKGTIQSAKGNDLTLIVPDKDNQLMRFKSDSQVKVMRDDKAISMSSLKAGDEVRASYLLDANGQMMLRSIEITKTSAKHLPDMPNMMK